MRVPRELLRDTATVEDYDGSGAHGPLYGAARSVRASIQATSRLLTDSRGQTVAVDALAIIRPEDGPVRPESKFATSTTEYRVVQCYAMPDERRPSQYELALTSYASRSTSVGSGSGS